MHGGDVVMMLVSGFGFVYQKVFCFCWIWDLGSPVVGRWSLVALEYSTYTSHIGSGDCFVLVWSCPLTFISLVGHVGYTCSVNAIFMHANRL